MLLWENLHNLAESLKVLNKILKNVQDKGTSKIFSILSSHALDSMDPYNADQTRIKDNLVTLTLNGIHFASSPAKNSSMAP